MMVVTKTLVLDVLKPLKPNILEFSHALNENLGGVEIQVRVAGVDEKTQDVEITLNDVPKEHTKVQALDVLVKFLKDLDITSYDIVHISEVDKESQYVITKLVTKNKTYSSSFFITKIKGKHLIREINFKYEVPTSH